MKSAPSFSITSPFTFATDSHVFPVASISLIKNVSLLAVSLLCIFCGYGNTSQDVYFLSDRFKVLGIYTSFVSAQMVDLKSEGNWAFEKYMGKTVSGISLPVKHEHSVPISVRGALPDPTTFSFFKPFVEITNTVLFRHGLFGNTRWARGQT